MAENIKKITCFINLTTTQDPTIDYEYKEGVVYWNGRNTFVNLLAAMIIIANSLLIYIILKSSILRKQVRFFTSFSNSIDCPLSRDSI